MPAISKAWVTIADGAVDPDSPLDSVLMTGIRDDLIHLREWLGAGFFAGAVQDHDHDNVNSKTPVLGNGSVTTAKIADSNVTEVKLGNSAVAQAKVKTATGEVSINNGSANLTLPGGQYGWYPEIKKAGPVDPSHQIGLNSTNTSYLTNIFITASGDSGAFGYAQQRYVQASPPYDLGGGEVPLFVFALVDTLGNIRATYAAADPPWANNGPTDIRADFIDAAGSAFKLARPAVNVAKLSDPVTREAELAKLDAAPQLVEITQAVKQADMPLIPHPFMGNPLTGMTVVLLDPVAPLNERLLRLLESGESVAALLHGDYLRIGNTPLPRSGPPGVIAVSANWKLT